MVSKTMVGKARRTWRATAISTLIRRFNIFAIKYKKSIVKDPVKKTKIKRVSDALRVKLFSDFVVKFMKEVKKARA